MWPSVSSSASANVSLLDDIFPVLPFSRREVDLNSVRSVVESASGRGGRRITCTSSDIRLMLADFSFRHGASGLAMGSGYLKFHYKLSGKNVVRFADGPEIIIESGRSAMVLHPEGLAKEDCFAPDARELSVTIACRRSTVLELLGTSSDEVPKRARRYFDAPDSSLVSDDLPLSIQMVEVLNSLINPSFSPWLQKIHVESKILELIGMSLHELTRRDFLLGSADTSLKPRDVHMLQAVHQFLQAEVASEITISGLCAKFGTNRAKLSAGYKALFGQTIFDYLHRLRMDHAMALLLNTQLQISEVAEKVGYHHQSSFSTAFREHHGFNPMNARRHQ
jgi:AraC-like DNA-binding protein